MLAERVCRDCDERLRMKSADRAEARCPRCGSDKKGFAPAPTNARVPEGLARRDSNKRNLRDVLEVIRATDTLELARTLVEFTSFTPRFQSYWSAFELAWSEGDAITDEYLLSEMLEACDETEQMLLLQMRAEMALNDLKATMDGVIE